MRRCLSIQKWLILPKNNITLYLISFMINDLNYDFEIPITPKISDFSICIIETQYCMKDFYLFFLSSSTVIVLTITHIAMFIILDPRKNHMKSFVQSAQPSCWLHDALGLVTQCSFTCQHVSVKFENLECVDTFKIDHDLKLAPLCVSPTSANCVFLLDV